MKIHPSLELPACLIPYFEKQRQIAERAKTNRLATLGSLEHKLKDLNALEKSEGLTFWQKERKQQLKKSIRVMNRICQANGDFT